MSQNFYLLPLQMWDRWFQNYVITMGAQPDETEEPTVSQLAALFKRFYTENRAPYCDFSVWTPFERRMSRIQKCRVYTPLGDGSYLQKDLPGPGSFAAWKASWALFKAACIMLNICSLATLETYAKQIEKLTMQWPRCWGLVYLADDSARAERLEKWRRRLTIEPAQGRQVPRDWDPLRPWSCILVQFAGDMEFWADHVHHPAAAWDASGGKGASAVASEVAPKVRAVELRQTGTDEQRRRGAGLQTGKSSRDTGPQLQLRAQRVPETQKEIGKVEESQKTNLVLSFATAGRRAKATARMYLPGVRSINVESAFPHHTGMQTVGLDDPPQHCENGHTELRKWEVEFLV